MAFNGSGVFVRLYNWVQDAAASVKITASRMDAEMDGFATGLSNCITRDGQGKPSASIDWNAQNLTNCGDLTAVRHLLTSTTTASGTGMYPPAASTIGLSIGSTEYSRLTTSAWIFGSGESSGTPVGLTLRPPQASGTNIAGATLTIQGGINTGSGVGGSIVFQVAPTGSNGTTAGTPATALTIAQDKSATFAGAASVVGNFAINTNKFTVAASSGDTAIAGAASVTGTFTATSPDTATKNAMLGGVRPAFSVHRNNVNQGSIGAGTYTKVQFNSEEFDTNNNFDSATNFRFLPTVAGKYQINLGVALSSTGVNSTCYAAIYKNGALYKQVGFADASTAAISAFVSAVVDMDGAADYIEAFIFNGDVSAQTLNGATTTTFMSGVRIA